MHQNDGPAPGAQDSANGPRLRQLVLGLATAAAVALGIAGGLAPLGPPAPAGDETATTRFSALRAAADQQRIASRPRPIGSPAQADVRSYLVSRLQQLGLETEVQRTTVVQRRRPETVSAGAVENVVARLPGRTGAGTILLVAHYDTVPGSPGASDNAAGVAALLETVRAVGAGEPLANDLVLLFSDGEEVALFGARAFREQHRWMHDVDLVLNFEARGAAGPSIMFETGPRVGSSLMRRFAAAVPHPVAASYSADVYRHLPNDTDFTPFRQAGIPGFNFAFIADAAAYHSPLDDVERTSAASLQHHGSYAISLVRQFGDVDLEALPAGGPAVYFNLPLLGLVVYPGGWVVPLAILALLAVAALLTYGVKRTRLRGGRLILALPVHAVAIAGAAVAAWLLHRLALVVFPTLGPPWPYLAGVVLLAVVAVAALLRLARRWFELEELAAAAIVWWLTLTLGSAYLLPSTSYLLTWPLLLASLGLAVRLAAPVDGSARHRLVPAVAAMVSLFLWAPTIFLVGVAFGTAAALLLALLTALPAVLFLPLLWPPRPSAEGITLGVAACLALLITGLAAAGIGRSDSEPPRRNSLMYVMDAERQKAWWATFDTAPDDWTARYLIEPSRIEIPDLFGPQPSSLLASPAPVLPLEPPRVTLLATESLADGQRRLRFRAVSPRGGARMRLALSSPANFADLVVDGQPAGRAEPEVSDLEIRLYGAPEEGFELEVTTVADPLQVTIVDRTWALPEVSSPAPTPRPPNLVRSQISDFTEVRATATL